MADLPEREVEVAVKTRGVGPNDPFYEDDNIRQLEEASLQYWRSLDDDLRRALIVLLRDTFGHLLVEPNAWLPGSLVPEPNGLVQIVLTIKTGDLHREVVLMRERAAEHMAEQRDQVAALREELHELHDG